MNPSKYQQVVLDEIQSGTGNLFINAVAGSGKSTLIKMIAESLCDYGSFEKDILAIAFNSHIVKDLAPKMPPNTKVATMHSVGLEAWKNYAGKIQVDQFKTGNVMSKFFNMNVNDEKFRYFRWRGSFTKIIGLFKAKSRDFWSGYNNHSLESLGNDIVAEFDIKLPKLAHYEVPIYWKMLKDVWDSCNALKNIIDYDDMIYFPVINKVPMPHYKMVLVDEAQDMNPIQIDFVLDMGSRTVAVGDPKQSIYAFRGADSQAIESYIKRSNAQSFPLSTCYRCARSIVKSAQRYVPQIEASETAPVGQVVDLPLDGWRLTVKDGDYVLCRCTAPLVKECLAMIREGRKATVKGKDIGVKLIELVSDISKNDSESSSDFYNKLKAYESANLEKLGRANREDQIIQLTDTVATLAVILEDAKDVKGIKQRIESIFSDSATTGITFCTVHKSKGLECENIFIIEPSLMPHPNAKSPVAIDQEKNIIYVAITRAKLNLYWVRGSKPTVKELEKILETPTDEKALDLLSPANEPPYPTIKEQLYKDSLIGKNLPEGRGEGRMDENGFDLQPRSESTSSGWPDKPQFIPSDDPEHPKVIDPIFINGTVSGRVQAQVPNLSLAASKAALDKVYDQDDSTKQLSQELKDKMTLKDKISKGADPEKALFDMLDALED